MKKVIKIIFIFLPLCAIVFLVYLYKLHALAVEGNKIFEYRCTNVNLPLISYKNSFLKFADYLKNPDKYSGEEVKSFLDGYISGMRAYIPEEKKWLEMQQEYMNRWDFKLIEPWYIKQAADYQWKMYEGYRDDAKYLLETIDAGGTNNELKAKFDDARSRRDKYNQLLFDSHRKFSEIKDWRKRFTQIPAPEGCNEDNLTIPDTSGAIDWDGKLPSPSPTTTPTDIDSTTSYTIRWSS